MTFDLPYRECVFRFFLHEHDGGAPFWDYVTIAGYIRDRTLFAVPQEYHSLMQEICGILKRGYAGLEPEVLARKLIYGEITQN